MFLHLQIGREHLLKFKKAAITSVRFVLFHGHEAYAFTDPEEVIRQAQQLVDAGYLEIVLTGIHTGGYGEDLKDYNLARLLRDLETKSKG